MKNSALEILTQALKDEITNLENTIKYLNPTQKFIDEKLDRINEFKEMIKELQNKQGS